MKDKRIEGSEPAFAQDENGNDRTGFSRREYAAIHLRVPNSGTQWLDDMITQRMRDDFAGQAMVGIASRPFVPDRMDRGVHCIGTRSSDQAREACQIANALLATRETDGGVGVRSERS